MTAINLAVWGDPIDHSRSPDLHAAAYAVLGLDWNYGRRQVGTANFAGAFEGLDASWRGLSLTMPLKELAFAAAVSRDRHAALTGAVNTLRFGADGPRGFNTDVGGLGRALRRQGIDGVGTARIVGAGATAASALVTLVDLGATQIEIAARAPQKAAALVALGDELEVKVSVRELAADAGSAVPEQVDVTIGTLPGGTVLAEPISAALAARGGALLDVGYSPWPSALATQWQAQGRAAASGISMLVEQALLQVRIFVAGDPAAELENEDAALKAMRAAVSLDEDAELTQG